MSQRSPDQERTSRAEHVARQIEDEILAVHLAVGAHLGRRAEFMSRFGVSPTIMNETLRILRSRGLIVVRPGTGGGIFVAAQPPQVRLGAIDLWFYESSTQPLELFKARVHLESILTTVAFDRASPDDVKQMRSCLLDVGYAGDAGTYLEAVMELHRVIARAAQIPVLDGMHETVIAAIRATLRGANFIDGHEEMLRHSVQVHEGIVDSIATRERAAFAKFVGLHDQDLVRAEDPSRSPHIENPDPASVHQTR